VKNADEKWPTASRVFYEVTAAMPDQNRDDYRASPTGYTLAECSGSG